MFGCKNKVFPKGHVKKDYAVIPETFMAEKVKMMDLVNKSVKFATMDANDE